MLGLLGPPVKIIVDQRPMPNPIYPEREKYMEYSNMNVKMARRPTKEEIWWKGELASEQK